MEFHIHSASCSRIISFFIKNGKFLAILKCHTIFDHVQLLGHILNARAIFMVTPAADLSECVACTFTSFSSLEQLVNQRECHAVSKEKHQVLLRIRSILLQRLQLENIFFVASFVKPLTGNKGYIYIWFFSVN